MEIKDKNVNFSLPFFFFFFFFFFFDEVTDFCKEKKIAPIEYLERKGVHRRGL